MTIKGTTYQNLTAGTGLTGGTTGGNSGFQGVSPLLFAQTYNGRICAIANNSGTNVVTGRITAAELATKAKFICPIPLATLPSANRQIAKIAWGNTQGVDVGSSVSILLTTTGKVQLVTSGSGSSVTRQTSTTSLVASPTSEYQIEIYADMGSSITTGSVHLVIYPYGSSTRVAADLDMTYTGIDLGAPGTGFTNFTGGKNSTDSDTGAVGFLPGFAVKTQTDAIDAAEPFGVTAPTVSAGANQSVSAGATVNLAATATGTGLTYAWAYTYPTTGAPTLTGATTATPSFTAGAAGSLYILTCSVTDTNSQTTTSSPVEVRVPLSGVGTEMRPISATPTGTWTVVGGTTGAVLADESDTTYLESPILSTTEATTRSRFQPSANRIDGTVSVRLAKTDTGTATVKVRLFIGSGSTTIIEEWTITPTTTVADYPHALAANTLTTITNTNDGWNQIRVEVAATT